MDIFTILDYINISYHLVADFFDFYWHYQILFTLGNVLETSFVYWADIKQSLVISSINIVSFYVIIYHYFISQNGSVFYLNGILCVLFTSQQTVILSFVVKCWGGDDMYQDRAPLIFCRYLIGLLMGGLILAVYQTGFSKTKNQNPE